jgi:hypothetical protein
VEITGIEDDSVSRSAGSRRERNDLFLFYTSLGFTLAHHRDHRRTVVLERSLAER